MRCARVRIENQREKHVVRKNPLLQCSLRELLEYKGQSGTYHPERMFEALVKDRAKEVEAFSAKERAEYDEFCDQVRRERDIRWMMHFFADRQDKPFTVRDITLWWASTQAFFVGKDASSQRNLACEMLIYFQITVIEYVNQGWIRRIESSIPEGKYAVVLADENPLVRKLIKPEEEQKAP